MYFFSHRKGHALQQNRRFSRLFVFNNSSLISPPFVHFITKKAASLLRQPLLLSKMRTFNHWVLGGDS